MPVVTMVHKELSPDGSHRHITEVCALSGHHYTRQEVVASIDAGERWWTSGGGTYALIRKRASCHLGGARPCPTAPYITTAPDHTTANNLENLPPC